MTSDWPRKKVLLVGLGLHGGGEATVRWLVKHGATVRVNDTKTSDQLAATLKRLKNTKGTTYRLGASPELADLRWANVVILNPAVPADAPWIKRIPKSTLISNVVTLFLQMTPSTVIGVTGTRGKTTVTTLIGHILKSADRPSTVAGVREVAIFDALDHLTPKHTAVLELSSFQLEWLPQVRRSPHIAVITNIHVDHLNRHRTVARYANIKVNLVRYQKPTDIAVLNAGNAWTKNAAKLTPGRVLWFSDGHPTGEWCLFVDKGWVSERRGRRTTRLFPLSVWKFPATHQRQNMLAAVAAARAADIGPQYIRQAVASFRGVPHRQELVRTWRSHRFINDTTATSPDGALAAMAVFPKAVFIVGGTDKKLDFRQMAATIIAKKIPTVFLPGNATDKLWQLLRRGKYRAPHMIAASMDEAVRHAMELAKPKQPIVLSPGAASFGLFVHEFDRGEKFVKAVKALR